MPSCKRSFLSSKTPQDAGMPASCGKNVCSLSAACRRARNAGGVLRAVRRGHGPLRGRKKGRERGHGPLQRGAQRGFAGRFCGDGNFLPFTSRFLVVPARPRLCPFARSRRPRKSFLRGTGTFLRKSAYSRYKIRRARGRFCAGACFPPRRRKLKNLTFFSEYYEKFTFFTV